MCTCIWGLIIRPRGPRHQRQSQRLRGGPAAALRHRFASRVTRAARRLRGSWLFNSAAPPSSHESITRTSLHFGGAFRQGSIVQVEEILLAGDVQAWCLRGLRLLALPQHRASARVDRGQDGFDRQMKMPAPACRQGQKKPYPCTRPKIAICSSCLDPVFSYPIMRIDELTSTCM